MDFLARCFELDFSGWLVLTILAGTGYTLLSQMLGEQLPALIGSPILVLSAAIGNLLVAETGLVSAGDKLMNMVVGMTAGMMIGGFVVVAFLWGFNALVER